MGAFSGGNRGQSSISPDDDVQKAADDACGSPRDNAAKRLRCDTVYLQSHVYVSQKDEAMNERIQIHPQVCHGKPVIRGTRVLVSTILGALAGGDSIEEVL